MSKVVVVLGPGRSGTSLMMRLLHEAGVQLSPTLKPADDNNPTGYWEDADILQLHAEALRGRQSRGFLPFREASASIVQAEKLKQGIREVVQGRLRDAGGRLWGFKDPRVCFFLPTWNAVFEEFGIEPVFIHCFRSPAAFSASYLKAYSTHPDRRFSPWIYFWRTYYGLKHANLTGYIAHYEDWEDDFTGQMKGVADYCGLGLSEDRVAALRQIYQPRQLRSPGEQESVEPMVAEIYRQLRSCAGVLSPDSELRTFVERVDLLLLQFGPLFEGIYASLDDEAAMKAFLQEARQDAADLRSANANLLQRLDNKAQMEWAEAANEARRAKSKYEEALRNLETGRTSLGKSDPYREVGRRVMRGISRGPLQALVALVKAYRYRDILDKTRAPRSGGSGKNKPALRESN